MKSLALRALRPYAVIAAALLLSAAQAFAYVAPGTNPDESNLSNHHTYTNRDGNTVHAPARSLSGRAPEGATARCRDGSYSFSQHRRGTCSRHGGVAQWL
ncbi:DUF3761 domain-containing protein [Paraburkholderia sp. Ac-20336]|uniref:DUF3761 domain-containing protein n=1 Tax=unclassified Paraburkholderia TaxID=2615204 RepID=UPI00141EFE6A|nr:MULTISPECIES: DUF3761 domain-containing protein [unclassified Paraburkholderia]MBN3805056.1 DUF3761 domain-containing protein [Paraburkholderia sp. Ac-20336]NIF79381.1 DUF3761 domain-containing protein [Paraburkholderia sp. Cy-641]